MGDVIQIWKPLSTMPDSHDAIGQAFRLAVSKLDYSVMPRQQACTALLNRIVDNASRGMRDVHQLSEEALSYLEKDPS